MASADGPQGPSDDAQGEVLSGPAQTAELQLFESLIHHLVEKGVLTKNDALSIVQSVAEVKRGQRETDGPQSAAASEDLIALRRVYASFELLTERTIAADNVDGEKVLHLRPPLHGDNPSFPKDD